MERCSICQFECKRVAKHIAEKHPEEFKRQDALVIKYYQEGMTAAKIAARDDIMYTGSTSVLRVLRKHLTPEQLEAGRRARIGQTLEAEYASGKYDWVNEINTERNKSEEGRAKNSEGLKKAYESGLREPLNKGLTKHNNERIAIAAGKASATMAAKAAAGELKTLLKPGDQHPAWKQDRSTVSRLYRKNHDFQRNDRKKIKERAGHKCEKCGITAAELDRVREITQNPRMHLECDHKVPIYKGGARDWEINGQALCSDCHIKKSALEHSEMMKLSG